jgi:DNA-binding response OmpR family regulator
MTPFSPREPRQEETMRILSISTDVHLTDSLACRLMAEGIAVMHCQDAPTLRNLQALTDLTAIVTDSRSLSHDDGLIAAIHDLKCPCVVVLVGEALQDRAAAWAVGAHVCVSRDIDLDELASGLSALGHKQENGTAVNGGGFALGAAVNADGRESWRLIDGGLTLLAPTGARIGLSHTEGDFLDLLMSNRGRTVNTRGGIRLGAQERIMAEKTLRTMICRLRRKVARYGLDAPIRSVYGSGYSFAPQRVRTYTDTGMIGDAIPGERPRLEPEERERAGAALQLSARV